MYELELALFKQGYSCIVISHYVSVFWLGIEYIVINYGKYNISDVNKIYPHPIKGFKYVTKLKTLDCHKLIAASKLLN